MDPKRYFVRPFGDADYEELSRLERATTPEFPSDPEEERHWDRTLDVSHMVHEKWVVAERESGQVVAIAALNHTPYSYDPHKFWVAVLVDPRHARNGIGRALASLLDAEAVTHRATCYWTIVRKDDPRALRFSERQGFVELRTNWMSVLDLSTAGTTSWEDRTEQFERDGIRFTTLAQEGPSRPEVRHRLFELWAETGRDVPRMGEYTPASFEQFSADLDGPSLIPEAFFLACHGDSYVASSHLQRDLAVSDFLIVGYTGTRSAFRGRGLATELKRRSLEFARQKGVRYLRTFNDSLNQPIWAINEKMGFRRVLEWSNQERRFGAQGTSPVPVAAR